MGSTKFPNLFKLSKEIWQWCEARNLWIFASYVNSKNNLADLESRLMPSETEWGLSEKAFLSVKQKFGSPNIDLFASNLNFKCKRCIVASRFSGLRSRCL